MANALTNSESMQILTLYMGDQKFGVPILKVQDVLQSQKLASVPMAESYIEGVMNLRGRIVTAINLRKRIEGKNLADNDNAMNVVIEAYTELYSILVDRVGEVLTLNKDDVEEAPLTLDSGWRQVIQGVYQRGEEIILMLDVDKIIYTERT
ncbi:MAG: chemotaxis protein CheW [Rhodospirillales bacterium]|nr:chemotaxis protein CheW [Rhodospirillales bacterium]MCB9997138.1 chemotaxis protein CheW [Rhodospirillales bacterium]